MERGWSFGNWNTPPRRIARWDFRLVSDSPSISRGRGITYISWAHAGIPAGDKTLVPLL